MKGETYMIDNTVREKLNKQVSEYNRYVDSKIESVSKEDRYMTRSLLSLSKIKFINYKCPVCSKIVSSPRYFSQSMHETINLPGNLHTTCDFKHTINDLISCTAISFTEAIPEYADEVVLLDDIEYVLENYRNEEKYDAMLLQLDSKYKEKNNG